MNRYGRQAMRHWQEFDPTRYSAIEDPETFFFMRGFPDLQSRESMKAQFYEGPLWKGELEGILLPMLEGYQVVVVDDPDGQIRF